MLDPEAVIKYIQPPNIVIMNVKDIKAFSVKKIVKYYFLLFMKVSIFFYK
jgi:hypothetical protein